MSSSTIQGLNLVNQASRNSFAAVMKYAQESIKLSNELRKAQDEHDKKIIQEKIENLKARLKDLIIQYPRAKNDIARLLASLPTVTGPTSPPPPPTNATQPVDIAIISNNGTQ